MEWARHVPNLVWTIWLCCNICLHPVFICLIQVRLYAFQDRSLVFCLDSVMHTNGAIEIINNSKEIGLLTLRGWWFKLSGNSLCFLSTFRSSMEGSSWVHDSVHNFYVMPTGKKEKNLPFWCCPLFSIHYLTGMYLLTDFPLHWCGFWRGHPLLEKGCLLY